MISKEEVQHIAKLARIQLSETELEKFQKDLGSILDYFNLLNELDVSGVKPMTHSVVLENVKRGDMAKEKEKQSAEKLIQMAPGNKDGFLKVKSIL